MKQTVVIRSMELKERAKLLIDKLPLGQLHEVIIRPFKVDRTLLQNSYYWVILGYIGNEIGQTKKDAHIDCKEMFLRIILERDDPEKYLCAITAIRNAERRGEMDEARWLGDKLFSTRDASVKQMAEYINDIQHHAASLDIRLPAPEYDK